MEVHKQLYLVFKVQEFMYKNTAGLSTPKKTRTRNRRKAQTLGRRVNRSKIQN